MENYRVYRHGIVDLKLPFSLFLALRYLKPKRTFLSIITLISVLGVMLGVTVLILVISVMTGFDRELRQKVVDWDAHILVTTEDVLHDWRDLTEKIRGTHHKGLQKMFEIPAGAKLRRDLEQLLELVSLSLRGSAEFGVSHSDCAETGNRRHQ